LESLLLASLACLAPQDELKDLESPDPAVWRRASEALIRRGDEAALAESAKRSDRAREALAEVRAHRRFGDAYPALQLLTYAAKDRPTPEVLADLSKALGLRFEDEKTDFPGALLRPLKDNTSLDVTLAYPLQALDALGIALGVSAHIEGTRATLYRGVLHNSSFTEYARHFVVAIESYEERRSIEASDAAAVESSLRFRVRYDWLCRPVGSAGFQFLAIEDDLGNSLVPERGGREASYDKFQMLSAQVGIRAPRREAAKLVRVRGTFTALFPERPAVAEIPLADPGKDIALSNLALKIDAVEEKGAEVRLSGKV
jgi:hypothetical protein